MPSSAIGSVLESMPGSVLENVLGGVLGCVLGVLHIQVSAGDGDVLYSRRRRCLVWPETEMSRMAGDGDVSYGRR